MTWLLDTNILSEASRERPDANVMSNMTRYEGEIHVAAPVLHELRFGWLCMPQGRKRDKIGRYLQSVVQGLPVLPYEATAARIHAELRLHCQSRGRALSLVDGQIAAICIANGATLVTRNERDFEGLPGLRWSNWFNE